MEGDSYSEGIIINAADISKLTAKSDPISECTKLGKLLNGGLNVNLQFENDAKHEEIKKSIEKAADLTSVFKPMMDIAICGECGYKDEPFTDKCPRCKSPYVVWKS